MNRKNRAAAAKSLGRHGEEAARELLLRLGYRLLDTNWRFGHLELDIICADGSCIVFVEVKTRRNADRGGPAYAVGRVKAARLCKAAAAWLSAHAAWSSQCRFDVVCLTGRENSFVTEHFIDAFPFVHPVGRSHSAWQPW